MFFMKFVSFIIESENKFFHAPNHRITKSFIKIEGRRKKESRFDETLLEKK